MGEARRKREARQRVRNRGGEAQRARERPGESEMMEDLGGRGGKGEKLRDFAIRRLREAGTRAEVALLAWPRIREEGNL